MIYHLSIKYDLNHHGSGQESYGNPTDNDVFSHMNIYGQKKIYGLIVLCLNHVCLSFDEY